MGKWAKKKREKKGNVWGLHALLFADASPRISSVMWKIIVGHMADIMSYSDKKYMYTAIIYVHARIYVNAKCYFANIQLGKHSYDIHQN